MKAIVCWNIVSVKAPGQWDESNLPEELRSVQVTSITDPTAASDSIEVLSYDAVNLDSEKFEIRRTSVPFKDCCLIYITTSAMLRTQTALHEDFEGIFVLGPNSHGTIDGAKLDPLVLLGAGPATKAEVIVERGYESIGLLVPAGVIHKQLDVRGFPNEFNISAGVRLWRPNAEVAEAHFALGLRIVKAAETSPDKFNNSPWARYGAQVEYLESLLATMETCALAHEVDTDKRGKSYSQVVRACEEYTLGLEGHRPYLSELCEAANVSKKTLHNAFRDIMGMSPITYLNRLRLHRAREDLRKLSRRDTTVTDVALRWGFWHFGEFSRAYKNCFGEVPSVTLKQMPDDIAPHSRFTQFR